VTELREPSLPVVDAESEQDEESVGDCDTDGLSTVLGKN
jgi:hypothetical protein